MKIRFLDKLLSIAVVLVMSISYAQDTKSLRQHRPSGKPDLNKPKASDTLSGEKALTLTQRRALAVLSELTKEIKYLTDNHLRIRSQAKIANSLWGYDEPRARSIFVEAFQEIDKLDFPTNQNGAPITNVSVAIMASPKFRLRDEVLRLISARDAALAEKLIADSKRGEEGEKSGVDIQKNERERALQSLALARSIAKSEPQKAAKIVRESMKFGLTPITSSVLVVMRANHVDIADNLFMELVGSVNNINVPLSETLGLLAIYIMPSEMETVSGRDPFLESSRIKITRVFLEMTRNVISQQVNIEAQGIPITNSQTARQDFTFLQRMTPLFSRFAPEGVAIVRQREAQLSKYLSSPEAEAVERRLQRPNDYEDTLDAATASGDPRQKDNLYAQAAMQATRQGKPDEALNIIEKISDKNLREITASIINYQTALKALTNNEIPKAHQHAKEIPFSPQRVEIYKKLAEFYINQKDLQHASEIIGEVKEWLRNSANDPKKAMGILTLTTILSSYDPTEGFEIVKLAVKAIEEADFSSKPNEQNRLREIPITIESLDFSGSFSPLAKADFERALLIAQTIKNKEASVLAQLAICQSILASS